MNCKSTLATVLCFVLLVANQGLARSLETEEAPLEPVPRGLLDSLLAGTTGAAGSTGGCTGGGTGGGSDNGGGLLGGLLGGNGGGLLGGLLGGSGSGLLGGLLGPLLCPIVKIVTGVLGAIPMIGPVLSILVSLLGYLLAGCPLSAASASSNGLLSLL